MTDIDKAIAKMEPEILALSFLPSLGEAATASIAISLKRIADVIAGDDKHISFTDAVADAIWRGLKT